MCSTMIIPTTRRITFTGLVEQVVQDDWVPPSRFSQLRVSLLYFPPCCLTGSLTFSPDAKQARDLLSILQEAKQNIDPRLAEMGRYSGGGGGGRGYGRGGHRGGRGGFTASNAAPLGRSRW